tara:strand:+ start:190 stop:1557 length:1368 start_codon:yes stop_codon:yes gene_type:complete
MEKIGLEIHGYLNTKEKLFCTCSNNSSTSKPNTNICPICTGSPGSKPLTPNASALKKCIQIALMLGSKVNTLENKKKLIWQRKHYNWPDLPKGYQTTLSGSYAIPVAEKGKFLGIRIRELHLEEDPAAWDPITGCIDYNRSGSPLIEIVTEPDFTSSEQVRDWLKQLIITLSYIKSLDRESGIKADVNVNIMGKSKRAEVKNVNSISEIVKVIEYEFNRHKKSPPQEEETLRWNSLKGKTEPMRSKESEADYRFISDPDLPVINIENSEVTEITKSLPETPQAKLSKLIKKHKIDKKSASVLAKNLEIVEFFENSVKKLEAKFVLPWVTVELLRVLNYNKKTLDEVEINIEHFTELLNLVKNKKLTELKAKQILNKFIPKSFSPKTEVKSSGRIENKTELESLVKKVIKNNNKAVQDYQQGNKASFNFLMGQVMHLSERRADYRIASEILKKLLN